MGKYFIRRLLGLIPLFIAVVVISFFLMQFAPGGPEQAMKESKKLTNAQIERWLNAWCLEGEDSIVATAKEFGGWAGILNCNNDGWNAFFSEQGGLNFLPRTLGGGDNGILHGDFGRSIANGREVLEIITERLPATLLLAGAALFVWVSLALVIGVIAAVRQYGKFDQASTFLAYIFYSLPTFWLGLMLIFFFAVYLHWLPTSGMVNAREWPPFGTPDFGVAVGKDPLGAIKEIASHMVLPLITLVAVNIAGDSRFVRASMLDVLNQDYVRTAKAKGAAPRRVYGRHALRNALLPVVTNVGLELPFLVAGAIVTETIFVWPGMGALFIQSLSESDYFVLMAVIMITSAMILLANLVADSSTRSSIRAFGTEGMDPIQATHVEGITQTGVVEPSGPATDFEVSLESLNQCQLAWRRFKRNRLALIGSGIFLFMVGVAIFGPVLLPYDRLDIQGVKKPGGNPPSLESIKTIFGTDNLGRSVLVLTANGARLSMLIGVMTTIIAVSIGVTARRTGRLLRRQDRRRADAPRRPPPRRPVPVHHPRRGPFLRRGRSDHHHPDLRAAVVAGPCPPRAGAVPVAARAGLRPRGPGGRGQQQPDHLPAHAAQRARPDHRLRDAARGRHDRPRGVRELPELRRPGDRRHLGQRPRSAQGTLIRGQLVVGVLPGHGHRADGDRHQLHGRRPARRPRPAEQSMNRATDDDPPARGDMPAHQCAGPLLDVRDLHTHFHVMDGDGQGRRRRQLLDQPGRDARHRRRIRLRQERHGAVDHAAAGHRRPPRSSMAARSSSRAATC